MAVQWQWKEKCGKVTVVDENQKEYTANWWEGNCLMIILNEWTAENGEEMYSMGWFFADVEHAKNCLGLSKGHTNMWTDEGQTITELTINLKYCYQWKKIVDVMTKAFPNIKITLYRED